MFSAEKIASRLDNNTENVSLKNLRNKEVYLTLNGCVDGREDEPGIPSFGGAAGTLGAQYVALKRIFGETFSPAELIVFTKELIGDTKIYLHDDTHSQHRNGHQHACDTGDIGCGAVARMLKTPAENPDANNAYGFSPEDRKFFWNFLKNNSEIKVLSGEHVEDSIIWIKNTPYTHEGEEHISTVKMNKKPNPDTTAEDVNGIQDFGYHETGRNIIIDYMAEDMADILLKHADHNALRNSIAALEPSAASERTEDNLRGALHYLIKEQTMKVSDEHTGLTAADLPPAKKLLDAGHVAYVKLSPDGNHSIELASK